MFRHGSRTISSTTLGFLSAVLTSSDHPVLLAVSIVSFLPQIPPLLLPFLENATLWALHGSFSPPSGQLLLHLLLPASLSSTQGLRQCNLPDWSFRRGQLPFSFSQITFIFSLGHDTVPMVIQTVRGSAGQTVWVVRGQTLVRAGSGVLDPDWCSG